MKHLTLVQRYQIQAYLKAGKSIDFIALELGADRSSIYRELKRNSKQRGQYNAAHAQKFCQERKERLKRPCRFDRASTINLNIRYGKMSLALLAQAAIHEFRKKMPQPYKRWNALHLAQAIFSKIDGDIRVKDDKILITCYNVPESLNLQHHYQGLPENLIKQNINPKVPWLFDFMIDFRFK